ncbi:hypothetical protein BT96DRAFT_1003962 [Gymnopus androsaceus JB14]|uniref:Uncharacterized protein n=1 Tax=Gymnopus androsaceus JB14 TaxID=1447944 RepID=A0A6A4GS93_9AGAR|nr:hypothetical protein BT96DRAFT_1003962 [Gymnopus androsaceus JB14]
MSIWYLMNWMNSGGRTKSETETTRLVNEVIMQEDFNSDDLKGFNAHSKNLRFNRTNNPIPSDKNVPSQPFSVPGLYFRDLISVIQSAFTEPLSTKFHFSPFKLFQTVPNSEEVHPVYSELYNSDAFIQEHDKVQCMQGPPDNPDCKLEKVVLGLMFWSDSTHLTSFSNAKLWPVYMMFGNLSKYIRSLLNSGACHHVAYIPLLDLMGLVRDICTRISKCRVFLWDKVKRAREYIYDLGMPINGTAVSSLLKETSSIPTLNAFIDCLGPNFPVSNMLAMNLLHEIELGVWKTLFTHLIRMLYASPNGAEKVAELDQCTTIRHLLGNASEMKKLAARDFKDLLQCSIPAFEHLFEHEHNEHLMKLLYRLAQWHALAKLHLHTEPTLEWLEKTTMEVGKLMREFRDKSASKFSTFELPREQDARA